MADCYRFRLKTLQKIALISVLLLLSCCDVGITVFLPLPTEIGDSFEFDLQLTVPYTIILPTWVGRRRRRHNNVAAEPGSASDRLSNAYELNTVEEVIASRLEIMFTYLNLDNPDCRRRLMCMISKDPDKYSPLGDMLLQHLVPLRNHLLAGAVNSSSIMWHYIELYEAGRKGFFPETNCTQETLLCDQRHPDRYINWDMLTVLQTVMKFIKIRFN